MNQIAILSGKGGTGKTSVSASFATLSQDTVVADCDVDASNLHLVLSPANYKKEQFLTGHTALINYDLCTNCGLCMADCRFDAISLVKGKVTINEVFCDGCQLCSRICPNNAISMTPKNKSQWFASFYRNGRIMHARLEPGEENSGKLVNQVREMARLTSKNTGYKTIVIDGPPGIGCPAISSLNGVNHVIVVTEPSMSAFHDLIRLMEVLDSHSMKKSVIINKYDINPTISEKIENYCAERNFSVLGKIPFDSMLTEAMTQGKSIIEYKPDSPAAIEIKKIWELCKS